MLSVSMPCEVRDKVGVGWTRSIRIGSDERVEKEVTTGMGTGQVKERKSAMIRREKHSHRQVDVD